MKVSVARWESRAVARGCYRTYSMLFIPFAIVVLAALPLNGREIMWYVDGLSQYYTFFVYEGQWLRDIVHGFLTGGGLQVPLWEWCMGYGVDVPTTFDVFLDPLNLISGIVPERFSEWVFQLLVVLRLYLAGLAFTFYCRTRGENKVGTVLGALLYALCGAGLTGVRWASGLHALVLFPVVLAGAERILAGKRPWVFVGSLALLAIISYYFTYMAIILLVGYLALRVVMLERPNLTMRRFMAWTGRFAALTLLCLLIAGFAMVPAAYALIGMDRLAQTQVDNPILYGANYYLHLVTQFLSTFEVGSDTYQGFGGMAFFGCVLLFAKRDKNRELRLVFVVLTALLLVPLAGSFFNVMNYASNRWAWAYALCVAFVLVRVTPDLLVLDAGPQRWLVRASAVYALLLLLPPLRTEANVAGVAALLGALLAIVLVRTPETRRSVLAGALVLTLGANGLYFLSPGEGGVGSQQVPLAGAYPMLTSRSVDQLATEIDDDSWWRYDAGQTGANDLAPAARTRNNSLILGKQGISFYNSIYNDHVDGFHTELAVAGDSINFSFSDLQSRSDLMALLGVRYYAYRNDGTDAVPYGFDSNDVVVARPVSGLDYQVLRSSSALPLGIAFDHAIARDDYLALTPVERQQALLQAVVLDSTSTGDPDGSHAFGASLVKADALSYEHTTVPFTVATANDVRVEDGRFVATRAGASITLACEGLPNADAYVYFTGLDYQALPPSQLISDEEREHMAWYSKAKLLLSDLSYAKPITYELILRADASTTNAYIGNATDDSHMFGGKDTWLAGLGYTEQPVRNVIVTFSQPGAYVFNELQLVAQTHELRAGWLAERSAHVLDELQIGCNQVKGAIDLDQPQTLLLTMAYNRGWSATVDGEPAELRVADTAFMALDLGTGHHTIELRYMTPGLLLGLAVTGVGLVCLVVYAIVDTKRRSPSSRKDASPV